MKKSTKIKVIEHKNDYDFENAVNKFFDTQEFTCKTEYFVTMKPEGYTVYTAIIEYI